LGGEFPRVIQIGKDGRDFPARQHDRRATVSMAVGRFLNREIS
jgi:hypothetical protein